MAGTTVYAIDIMLDTNTKYILMKAVLVIEGSIFIKELGGASYILASLLGIAMIIVKIVKNRNKRPLISRKINKL